MAAPLPSKKTVDLAASGPRVSRIRRDPPVKIPEVTVVEQKERETRDAVVGIVVLTLALLVVGAAVFNSIGWTVKDMWVQPPATSAR